MAGILAHFDCDSDKISSGGVLVEVIWEAHSVARLQLRCVVLKLVTAGPVEALVKNLS